MVADAKSRAQSEAEVKSDVEVEVEGAMDVADAHRSRRGVLNADGA